VPNKYQFEEKEDIMNPFRNHPHKQGISYNEHLVFAMGISIRLFKSVIAFALHALFPFININRTLDLEETAIFIRERNGWIEKAKQNKQTEPIKTPVEYKIKGITI
jgi:hypothetical protein